MERLGPATNGKIAKETKQYAEGKAKPPASDRACLQLETGEYQSIFGKVRKVVSDLKLLSCHFQFFISESNFCIK